MILRDPLPSLLAFSSTLLLLSFLRFLSPRSLVLSVTFLVIFVICLLHESAIFSSNLLLTWFHLPYSSNSHYFLHNLRFFVLTLRTRISSNRLFVHTKLSLLNPSQVKLLFCLLVVKLWRKFESIFLYFLSNHGLLFIKNDLENTSITYPHRRLFDGEEDMPFSFKKNSLRRNV